MLVIPAIDIRQGRCVRLIQGKLENEEIYSNDPVFIAKLWEANGAKRIHIVDLDGAFSGNIQNLELIKEIRQNVKSVLQVGGGIRTLETIKKIVDLGIEKIILGTVSIYYPGIVKKAVEIYPDRIIISIDVREGKVAIGGWKELTAVSPEEAMTKMMEMGIKEFIFTNIEKDGMLSGPNFSEIETILSKTKARIIISGGISSLQDIIKLKELQPLGLEGVIVGKALYTGQINLKEAIESGGGD